MRIFYIALPVVAVLAGIGLSALPRAYRRSFAWVLLAGGVIWAVPCILTDLFTSSAGGDSDGSFLWESYPPFGAWRGLRHLFATGMADPYALDIVWFRLAHLTYYASVIVPFLLMIVAALLCRKAFVLSDSSSPRSEHLSPHNKRI